MTDKKDKTILIKIFYEGYCYLFHEELDQSRLQMFICSTITKKEVIIKWIDVDESIILRSYKDFEYVRQEIKNRKINKLRLQIEVVQQQERIMELLEKITTRQLQQYYPDIF